MHTLSPTMTQRNNTLPPYWHFAILAIYFLILGSMINPFLIYFIGFGIPEDFMNILSWMLLVILTFWFLFIFKGLNIFKFIVTIFYIKWFWYIFILGKSELRKDFLIFLLLIIAIIEADGFRETLVNWLLRYKYLFLAMATLSFLPFINQSITYGSRYSEIYNVYGLWSNAKQIAYIFIILMIMIPAKRIYLISCIYILLIISGSRGATLAGTIFIMYLYLSNAYNTFMRKAYHIGHINHLRISVAITFMCLITLLLYINSNTFFIGLDKVINNFRPLWETEITSPTYGSGRILLNTIAIEGLADFNLFDLTFGKSYTDLGDLYEYSIWGWRSWPHNDYVMLIWTYGVIGILSYVYLLYIFPWKKYKGHNRMRLIAFQLCIFILSVTAGFANYLASYLFIIYYGVFYGENRDTCSCIQQQN